MLRAAQKARAWWPAAEEKQGVRAPIECVRVWESRCSRQLCVFGTAVMGVMGMR